jgi:hypothetical protein
MNVRVELVSEEYGTSEFIYPTLQEAVRGFDRLVKKAKFYSKRDGIPRQARIVSDIEA